MQVREKTSFFKKSSFSDRLECFFTEGWGLQPYLREKKQRDEAYERASNPGKSEQKTRNDFEREKR